MLFDEDDCCGWFENVDGVVWFMFEDNEDLWLVRLAAFLKWGDFLIIILVTSACGFGGWATDNNRLSRHGSKNPLGGFVFLFWTDSSVSFEPEELLESDDFFGWSHCDIS